MIRRTAAEIAGRKTRGLGGVRPRAGISVLEVREAIVRQAVLPPSST
jgi:hypothetical protein